MDLVDVNLDPGTFTYYINKLQHLVLLLASASKRYYQLYQLPSNIYVMKLSMRNKDYVKNSRLLKGVPVKSLLRTHLSETLALYQSQHSSDSLLLDY